jgi:hypothetical protein
MGNRPAGVINLLTRIQAFAAMQYFFDQYYWKTLSNDFGGISSCLMLADDNKPVDAALEKDWIDSAQIIIPNYRPEMLISTVQAYAITKEFLELYCRIGFSEEVQALIDRMQLDQNNNIIDLEIRQFWDKSLELAIQNGPMYFSLLTK